MPLSNYIRCAIFSLIYSLFDFIRIHWIDIVVFTVFAAVASFYAGQDAGFEKAEKVSAQERLVVLCKDQPANAVCMTVHKEK